ncbi:hypothetical protein [Mesorhizobium sp.]|nr:hypothetical protein [Mesorhizobium sp.]
MTKIKIGRSAASGRFVPVQTAIKKPTTRRGDDKKTVTVSCDLPGGLS